METEMVPKPPPELLAAASSHNRLRHWFDSSLAPPPRDQRPGASEKALSQPRYWEAEDWKHGKLHIIFHVLTPSNFLLPGHRITYGNGSDCTELPCRKLSRSASGGIRRHRGSGLSYRGIEAR
jgi:hypothetical protein